MIQKGIIALLLGAGLWACSDVYTITATSNNVEIQPTINSNSAVDSLIAPYQGEMISTMSTVVAYAEQDFTRGRPNAALNNWSADAIFNYSLSHRHEAYDTAAPVICLLNFGGLRNPINEGLVTTGDIYKLMPFDNEIVWVEMPWETVVEIADYLETSGGEPLAGALFDKDTLLINGVETATETYWVITSDYLMNGGDRMDFFQKRISFHYSNALMREAMMEQAKMQDTLLFNDDVRIRM